MPAKVCPRCGEQYEHLHSTTCPQCFAKLVVVDDATAEAFAEARAEVVQTPEFQAAKQIDDERFREQSFGACLGVIAIFFVTALAAVGLLLHAAHVKAHPQDHPAASAANIPLSADNVLPALPVAAATLDDVFPAAIGPFRRIARDQSVNIPGTLTPIFHARYVLSAAAPALDIYAVPAARPTPELNSFRLGLALAAQTAANPTGAPVFFATEHWRLAVLGSHAAAAAVSFPSAYVAQFAARSQ